MKLRSVFLFITTLLIALPSQATRISAWIPPWDAASLSSIQLHAGDLDESNPVWYSLSSSGTIVTNWNAENPTWIAAMTGTQLVPTIQNVVNGSYSAAVVEQLIATSASREAHAQAITELVVAKNFDGIDIDYEALPSTARANFTAFIQLLASKLHGYGKQLSVTVHPKTSDSQNWNGPGSQDWIAIGAAADTIKIMAYDYHWSTSTAGPITPLTWLDQVTTYAEATIPAAKIMIALPWYGYDWRGSSGRGVVYSEAMELARANGATITRDANGEATFTYSDHVVYFQDGTSYARKVELLQQKHPSIGGIAHWRTGNEDPEFWNVIRNLGSSSTPPASPDFTVSGAATMSVRVNKSASTQYAVSRVGGFSEAISVTAEKLSPYNATVTVSPATLTGATTSTTLNVSTTRSTPAGTFSVRLRFTGGGIVREQIVTVTVTKR